MVKSYTNSIVQTPPAGDLTKTAPYLALNNFDKKIWDKGGLIFFDQMLKCPCYSIIKGEDGGLNEFPSSACENCGGSGWFLVQRHETRAIITSINKDTKFKEWSEEKLGTMNVTTLERNKLSFMDRIILKEAKTYHNETIFFKKFAGKWRAKTFYEILTVEFVLLFETDEKPLKALVNTPSVIEYTTSSNYIELPDGIVGNNIEKVQCTIKYVCRPQYHILDIPRDSMVAPYKEIDKSIVAGQFPIHAVARRSHFVLDSQSYSLANILDNSQPLNN